MIKIDEGILGPDATPQFFPGDEFTRPFRQGSKNLERLLLAANANSILAQHPGLQIQFINAKTNGSSSWIGHTHGDLGMFDATTHGKVIRLNGNSSVLAKVTLRVGMS